MYTKSADDHSAEGLFTNDSLEKASIKRMRKIRKMEPKESSHLNFGTATSSITYSGIHKTLNYKMTNRRNVAHQSFEKKKFLAR